MAIENMGLDEFVCVCFCHMGILCLFMCCFFSIIGFHCLNAWSVVSSMNFMFHFILWDVILPIDELIFFKMVIAPPTRINSSMVYLLNMVIFHGYVK